MAKGVPTLPKRVTKPTFRATNAMRRRVQQGIDKGLTKQELANLIGISLPTFRREFGDMVPGRKTTGFQMTDDDRLRVSIAAAAGMPRAEIALAMGMAVGTLWHHFRAELTVGAVARRVEVLHAMHSCAIGGNVSAQRAFLSTTLAPPEMDKPNEDAKAQQAPTEKLGKKAQQEEDARQAAFGTAWEDLLPPTGIILQ